MTDNITFLDDRRVSSSGKGIMVTSGGLGRLSRRAGGASGRGSSARPRGVLSLGDKICCSGSFASFVVFWGDERFMEALDAFTELKKKRKP